MCALPYPLLPESAVNALTITKISTAEAALLASLLLQPQSYPQVLIDCGAQPCRRTLGMCYFLSQLLLLRQQGNSVWLRNVDPLLRRCLQQMGLTTSFFWAE